MRSSDPTPFEEAGLFVFDQGTRDYLIYEAQRECACGKS
jgi:hypothetical protein